MAQLRVFQNNFAAGELNPKAFGRVEFERYQFGAKLLENWRVLLQGGAQTRFGTQFVAEVKSPGNLTVLLPFVPKVTEGHIIEAGDKYFRFYTNNARIGGGTPVEVVTPYEEADLRDLRTAQSFDVMFVTHGSYAPQQLSRTSPTSFTFAPLFFFPPPTFEAGEQPARTLTPSGTTGNIQLNLSGAAWFEADVQRVVVSGSARCVITNYITNQQVDATVLSPFPDTSPIAPGDWMILGSPAASCKPDKAGPVGAQVILELQADEGHGPELISDGDFAGGQGGWVDASSPLVVSGTHDQPGGEKKLTDSSQNFVTAGVQVGNRVLNTTQSTEGAAAGIETKQSIYDTVALSPELDGGGGGSWANGDSYEVRKSGAARFANGVAILNGGPGGVGSITRSISTAAGFSYELTFDIAENSASVMVGTATDAGDVLAEATYPIGNEQKVVFEAKGATSIVQLRNNQPRDAHFDNVSCKEITIGGWRLEDVGKYVRINQGLVQITERQNSANVLGEIVVGLNSEDIALPGAWRLEEESWSDARGWPRLVMIYEQRLYFASTATFPQTIWGSAIDNLTNFFVSGRPQAAIQFTIQDSAGNISLNDLQALVPGDDLIALTSGPEYHVQGANEDAITSENPPRIRAPSVYGSAFIQPLRIGNAVLFVQVGETAIREMAFHIEAGNTVPRNLARLAGHLFEETRIQQLYYEAEPEPTVWAIRDDGVKLGFTYSQIENVEAWFRETTAGTYDSGAVIKHPIITGDQEWVIVRRGTTHAVEIVNRDALMTPSPSALASEGWRGLTVDSAVIYNLGASPVTTLTGLGHLAGEQVYVVSRGMADGPYTVSGGGSITVTQPVDGETWVGLLFQCTGETLPPEVQLQTGSIQQKQKRWGQTSARLHKSLNLRINGEEIVATKFDQVMGEGAPLLTGDYDVTLVGYDKEAPMIFEQPLPYPATLLGLFTQLDVEEQG